MGSAQGTCVTHCIYTVHLSMAGLLLWGLVGCNTLILRTDHRLPNRTCAFLPVLGISYILCSLFIAS